MTNTMPAVDGFTFPAEWEPHAATWISWPHRSADWPGKMESAQWAFVEIVRHLTQCEDVYLLVQDDATRAHARDMLVKGGADLSRVRKFKVRTDRSWMRDSGPLILRNDAGDLAIADFGFNAWAKYPEWQLDNQLPTRVAHEFSLPRYPILHEGKPFVLEGGAIDGNGAGTILATEECLLDQSEQPRNPGMSKEAVEQCLRDSLGARAVVWLGRGIAGDDTHGHIDDVCRFVNETTVVLCRESDSQDENHALLEENHERLAAARTADGVALEVVDLPMPSPLMFDGTRLPASYANFYIANDRVLVPTFNDPKDRVALGILADLFPDRTVVGIHAVDLVWGFGTVHCLTQQHPA